MTAEAVCAIVEAASGDRSIASIAFSTLRNRDLPVSAMIESRRFYPSSPSPHGRRSFEAAAEKEGRSEGVYPLSLRERVGLRGVLAPLCPRVPASCLLLRPYRNRRVESQRSRLFGRSFRLGRQRADRAVLPRR